MLSDEQLDVLSGALVPLYQHLESWVIADVARRIRDTLKYTRTAELEVKALQALGYSPAQIRARVMKLLRADKEYQKQVEENTLQYKREVAELLKQIDGQVMTVEKDVMETAASMAWENDLSLWDAAGADLKENKELSQITKAMQRQTQGELQNITKTTGFRTSAGIEPVREVYRRELDKAVVKLTSGAATQRQCVQDAVRELAQSGLRTIDYDSGRSYQIDTAVRMCVNTAAGQLAAQISNANILENDVTLVRVSEHWGARDKGTGVQNHKEWQGKVYSIDGKQHPEEEKRIRMEIIDLQDATGYSVQESSGAVDGLHGVNCRHNHYAWFEGISELPKPDPEPEPREINGKTYSYYDMTQGMRRRERELRALKREREALDTLGENSKDIRAKIRQKTKEYNQFCDACGLRPKLERTRVEGKSTDLTKTESWKEYKNAVKSIEKPIRLGDLYNVEINRSARNANISAKDILAVKHTIAELSREYQFRLDEIEIGNYTDEEHLNVPMLARVTDNSGELRRILVLNNANAMWSDSAYRKDIFDGYFFAGRSVEEFTEHELAHFITYEGCDTMEECEALDEKIEPMYTNGVSRYAWKSKDGAETIAEAFVKKRQGRKINDEANQLLELYVEVWRK